MRGGLGRRANRLRPPIGRPYTGRMQKYICTNCGYIYDPEIGDPERGFDPPCPFAGLPDDWTCPICYVGKDRFDPL